MVRVFGNFTPYLSCACRIMLASIHTELLYRVVVTWSPSPVLSRLKSAVITPPKSIAPATVSPLPVGESTG